MWLVSPTSCSTRSPFDTSTHDPRCRTRTVLDRDRLQCVGRRAGLQPTFVLVAGHRVTPATAERFRPTVTRPSSSSGHTVHRTVCARRLRRTCARIHKLGPDRVRTRPLSRRKDPARSGPGGVASTPESAAHVIGFGRDEPDGKKLRRRVPRAQANGFLGKKPVLARLG